MGHRMSALPLAQFCAHTQDHNIGSGRAAVMSSAWHAKLANAPLWRETWNALTDEEAAIVERWQKPTKIETPAGLVYYEEMEKELEVTLDCDGGTGKDVISVGHLDMAMAVSRADGVRLAYVGDLKKGEYTTEDGPHSLQLAAYGFAYASLRNCDAFVRGIWAGEEGRWTWEEGSVDLETPEAYELWLRVKAAILNTKGDYNTGAHCRGCWSRLKCPAWPSLPELTGLTVPDDAITADKVADLLLLAQSAKEKADMAIEYAKAWSQKNGAIRKDGKVWLRTMKEGRESLDKDSLFREMPEAKRFLKQGKPYSEYRWLKDRP